MKNLIFTPGLTVTVIAFGFNPNIYPEKPQVSKENTAATALIETNNQKGFTLPTLNDTIVEFGFDNVQFEYPNFLNFDVLIRTNIDGLEFGKGELFTQYPESAFGSSVVANGYIEIQKGDVIDDSQYTIITSDEEEDIFKAIVNGGCVLPSANVPENTTPLSTNFQLFIRVRLEIQDISAAGLISMDDVRMDGNVFFVDPGTDGCRPFTKVVVPNPIDIEDVCKCSSYDADGNSWYVYGGLYYSDYQQDVYVFRLKTKQTYTDQVNQNIVDSISFHDEPGLKYNTFYFDPLSSQEDREQLRNQIRNDSLFELEFPAITAFPAADFTEKKWMFTNDVVNIVFNDPDPDQTTVQYIADKYNLSVSHVPNPSLPKGDNSWTYSYTINPTDCKCRNVIDISREIFQLDSALVKIAEPWLEPSFEPYNTSDPYFPDSWHILNTGQCLGMSPYGNGTADADCDIEESWGCGTGAGITVAVIDKGIYDKDHPDISSKYTNGYDFIDNDDDVSSCSATTSAHGQCCAGLIGAIANNETGMAGVAYDAKIVPMITWFGNSHVAFQYACSDEVNADVISCSWGWEGAPVQAIVNEIHLCRTLGRGGKGIVIVFSAGNVNNNTDTFFPGTLDDVIGVIASNPDDGRKSPGDGWGSWGSNYGALFDVAAPGTHVITTDLLGNNGYNDINNGCEGGNDLTTDYTYFAGTSAAAPIVSGACAVILSANPSLTATQVQHILENTAEKVGGYNYNAVSPGRSIEMGYGRINLYEAACNATNSENIVGNSFSARLYPNPVKDEAVLQFSLEKPGKVNIAIYDAMGNMLEMVMSDSYVSSSNLQTKTIRTDRFSSGLYYIVLKMEGGMKIQSIPLTVAK
jgi:subtilisin family serine protease